MMQSMYARNAMCKFVTGDCISVLFGMKPIHPSTKLGTHEINAGQPPQHSCGPELGFATLKSISNITQS